MGDPERGWRVEACLVGLGARKVWSVVSGGDLVQDTYGGYRVQLHSYPDTLPPVSTVSTCTGTLAVITLQLPASPTSTVRSFPAGETQIQIQW